MAAGVAGEIEGEGWRGEERGRGVERAASVHGGVAGGQALVETSSLRRSQTGRSGETARRRAPDETRARLERRCCSGECGSRGRGRRGVAGPLAEWWWCGGAVVVCWKGEVDARRRGCEIYCKSRVWTGSLEVTLACADSREVPRENHVDFRDIQADGVYGEASLRWCRRGGNFRKLNSL